jgi:hypothetical protein
MAFQMVNILGYFSDLNPPSTILKKRLPYLKKYGTIYVMSNDKFIINGGK